MPPVPAAPGSTAPGHLVVFALVAVVYAVAAQMAWSLFGAPEIGMSFYPAAGITLGLLIVLPKSRWPTVVAAILTAEIAVDLVNGIEGWYAVAYGVANATEPVVGALAIGQLTRVAAPPLVDLTQRAGMARFVVGGLLAGPMVGAIIGATTRTIETGSSWEANLVGWWVGDGLGVLSVGTTLVLLANADERAPLRDRRTVVLVAAASAVSVVTMQIPFVGPYLVVPILMVVAFGAGLGGVAIVGFVTAMAANVATALGDGPFADIEGITPQMQVVDTQLLVAVSLVAAYVLAIEIRERERADLESRREHAARIRAESMQEVAIELQHAMLGRPDVIDGVAVATAYHPAGGDVEIGGDWYDAIRLPDDRTALVIGDVVGHSLAAAKAMGQLRSAIRTLAPLFQDPAELLHRLEAFVSDTEGASPTTLVYAVYDAPRSTLRYSCAGHPPPLLLPDGGEPTFLLEGRGAPLGAYAKTTRTVGEADLGPGDTVVLYTDGLVERRGESIDVGLQRLARAAGARMTNDVEALCAHLLDVFIRTDDDVALLVVRPTQPTLRRRIDATPARLPGLRADLRSWLAEHGVDVTDAGDVLVSAGEAVANAVEHAYLGRPPGAVQLEAELIDAGEPDLVLVELRVRDDGTWRRPAAAGSRGRGEKLMKALADDVDVRTGDAGTSVRIRHRVRLEGASDELVMEQT